jgi:hypothetical protein
MKKTKQWEDDVKDPDIDMLIIDECQDCNVPQRKAIDKMARNVKRRTLLFSRRCGSNLI